MNGDILVGAAKSARDALDYWGLFATIAGVVILAIYTTATLWQVKLTKAALTQARESSLAALAEAQRSYEATEKSNKIAAAALEETRKSNEHTAESNRIARQSMEMSKRAWLTLDGVSGDNPDRVHLVIKNTGGAPATSIEIPIVEGWIDIEREQANPRPVKASCILQRSLGNGESAEADIFLDLPEDLDIQRVKSGQERLWAAIIVMYHDGFALQRMLLTCAFLCKNPTIPAGQWSRVGEKI